MQPYQNLQPSMNQFQHSMYYPQQPMMPSYMDRLGQLQNQQMQLQGFSTMGKIVDGIEAVKSTDIPMDGNLYYFPKADGTEIYTKNWQADGTTRILTYKPFFDSVAVEQEKTEVDVLGKFATRFDAIDERFDKIEKMLTKTTSQKAKKESEAE